MKTKIQNFILFAFVMSLCSCSSDDDGNTSITTEGRWLVSSLLTESSFDFNMDGTASRDLFLETSCYDGNYIQFFDDGEVVIEVDFTYIFIDDNNQHDFQCQNGISLTSTWTRNGNTITVENGDEDIIGIISGNNLTVTIPNGF